MKPNLEAAHQVLHELVAGRKTPAVQYRFVAPDAVICRHDEGWGDVAARKPVGPTTTYNGFSVTKTFTALAVLQLAERGLVELDRPASDYLSGFPYSREVTVRHLLTHSAGIPNPIPLSWIHLREEHPSFDRDEFFRRIMDRHSKARSKPNARFAYSNLGYVLLGQIIENVSTARYEQYVTREILEPLGLSSSDLGFLINDSQHARGFHRKASVSYFLLRLFLDMSKFTEPAAQGWQAFRPFHMNGVAYGGLIGTADGFARYVQALVDPAGRLLSQESRRLLFAEHFLSDGKPSGMSLSWFKGRLAGHDYYCHAGGGGGYYTEVRIYPALQRGSVLLFNRSGLSDVRFLDRVDRHVLPAVAR